jgi:hypothetical protein
MMTDGFHLDCRPSAEQWDFIHSLPENCREAIFEGCTLTDTKPEFDPTKDKLSSHARKQTVYKLPEKYSNYNDKYVPFAFLHVGTPNELGETLRTYPTKTTELLRLPWTKKCVRYKALSIKRRLNWTKKSAHL